MTYSSVNLSGKSKGKSKVCILHKTTFFLLIKPAACEIFTYTDRAFHALQLGTIHVMSTSNSQAVNGRKPISCLHGSLCQGRKWDIFQKVSRNVMAIAVVFVII